MEHRPTYDEDVYAWSQHQAEVLRGLAMRRRGLPNDLDLDRVAEEIEDVGSEKLEAVLSLLGNIMVHLLKLASVPGALSANHWRREIRSWQRQVLLKYRPAMRQHVDLERLWRLAVRDARADLADEGDALLPVADSCPLMLNELLDEGFDVDRLIAVLRPDAPCA
ncbi:DUF29 domain-containing protein [Azospirillum halopraeferens]|uniref:DUF29 domain-containing protein n=1 Tax=Azospirillum halopraeferens TaxID=34010 RepID=UPI00041C945D|nr:DUF29 domain-containing protein [Azospirillum halopraeferens]